MPARSRSGTGLMPRRGRDAAAWLSLAATPTLALMALLTAGADGTMHHASPLSGMTLMYLLMSAFHMAPWLRLISSRQGEARLP
jgi:hypothetical protein